MNTSRPDTLGFHCSGECWTSAGGPEGVLSFLAGMPHSDELGDLQFWFAEARWTDEAPTLIKIPELGEVHPIQDYINLSALATYRRGSTSVDVSRKSFETHPTLFKFLGKIFIFQGTHRLLAAILNGESEFLGWFIDLDGISR